MRRGGDFCSLLLVLFIISAVCVVVHSQRRRGMAAKERWGRFLTSVHAKNSKGAGQRGSLNDIFGAPGGRWQSFLSTKGRNRRKRVELTTSSAPSTQLSALPSTEPSTEPSTTTTAKPKTKKRRRPKWVQQRQNILQRMMARNAEIQAKKKKRANKSETTSKDIVNDTKTSSKSEVLSLKDRGIRINTNNKPKDVNAINEGMKVNEATIVNDATLSGKGVSKVVPVTLKEIVPSNSKESVGIAGKGHVEPGFVINDVPVIDLAGVRDPWAQLDKAGVEFGLPAIPTPVGHGPSGRTANVIGPKQTTWSFGPKSGHSLGPVDGTPLGPAHWTGQDLSNFGVGQHGNVDPNTDGAFLPAPTDAGHIATGGPNDFHGGLPLGPADIGRGDQSNPIDRGTQIGFGNIGEGVPLDQSAFKNGFPIDAIVPVSGIPLGSPNLGQTDHGVGVPPGPDTGLPGFPIEAHGTPVGAPDVNDIHNNIGTSVDGEPLGVAFEGVPIGSPLNMPQGNPGETWTPGLGDGMAVTLQDVDLNAFFAGGDVDNRNDVNPPSGEISQAVPPPRGVLTMNGEVMPMIEQPRAKPSTSTAEASQPSSLLGFIFDVSRSLKNRSNT